MRVLTDPVEIRAFRKRQVKKLARMGRESAVRMLKHACLYLSLASALIALFLISMAGSVAAITWILQNCLTT